MADIEPVTRKTRFVCVSDTHNATNGSFKLPKGDVLIHAGDLTNQGSFKELQKAVKWIEEADFEAKVVIAGNHDITLDTPFYTQYGLYFHNQDPQNVEKCQQLLVGSSSILYLRHEAATINLSSPNGPRTTFKIFGSPFSPSKGQWAFGYDSGEAAQIWDRIPLDADVVVTHTPPKYHCDETKDRRAAGCETLRCMLWRVRPRLAVCGHVHEGRGAEIIKWDLGIPNVKYKEAGVKEWKDPGKDNKKISLVNLSAKSGTPIANDGSSGHGSQCILEDDRVLSASVKENRRVLPPSMSFTRSEDTFDSTNAVDLLVIPTDSQIGATRGQGGQPPSSRCDLEAVSGRLGRKETCIVNAAIMASSWPHSGAGGKKFNKPIVVDIDLPVRVE